MPNLYLVSTDIRTRIPARALAQSGIPTGYRGGDVYLLVNRQTPIPELVDYLRRSLEDTRELFGGLFILANGEPGRLRLGAGLDRESVRFLAPLRDFFKPAPSPPAIRPGMLSTAVITPAKGGFCIIKGCAVASAKQPAPVRGWFAPGLLCGAFAPSDLEIPASPGYRFIRVLAETLGIQVTGCVDEMSYCVVSRATAWDLPGQLITVYPNGEYRLGNASGVVYSPASPLVPKGSTKGPFLTCGFTPARDLVWNPANRNGTRLAEQN